MTVRKLIGLVLILSLCLCVSSYAEIRIFFSPGERSIAEEIINQMNSAESYIDIAIYSFTYEPIAEAIIKAKNRGVKIRILMDHYGGSVYQFLLDNDLNDGIEIRQYRGSGKMHNKFAVIDRKILFTGSYNWSAVAEEKSEENLLEFIEEEEEIRAYQNRFNSLWDDKSKE